MKLISARASSVASTITASGNPSEQLSSVSTQAYELEGVSAGVINEIDSSASIIAKVPVVSGDASIEGYLPYDDSWVHRELIMKAVSRPRERYNKIWIEPETAWYEIPTVEDMNRSIDAVKREYLPFRLGISPDGKYGYYRNDDDGLVTVFGTGVGESYDDTQVRQDIADLKEGLPFKLGVEGDKYGYYKEGEETLTEFGTYSGDVPPGEGTGGESYDDTEIKQEINDIKSGLPFKFGIDSDGEYGYYKIDSEELTSFGDEQIFVAGDDEPEDLDVKFWLDTSDDEHDHVVTRAEVPFNFGVSATGDYGYYKEGSQELTKFGEGTAAGSGDEIYIGSEEPGPDVDIWIDTSYVPPKPSASAAENAARIAALEGKVPFAFGVVDGVFGYYKDGADTLTPFKTPGESDVPTVVEINKYMPQGEIDFAIIPENEGIVVEIIEGNCEILEV